jgi:hypothetical protein
MNAVLVIDLHQCLAPGDQRKDQPRLGFACQDRRIIMNRFLVTAAVIVAANAMPSWITSSKAQESHEAHHPAEVTAPTPSQPGAQAAQSSASPSAQQAQGMGPGMMGGMPMMNMMGMMRMTGVSGPGMGGMATIDRVEGRISFLRTELKITNVQENAWNAFADALRANAKRLGDVRSSMTASSSAGQQQTATLADRLKLQERWLVARLEGTRAIKAAFVSLVSVLSDEQRRTADELLGPHMGMMAMMSGQIQAGQMQPGQMPGPMMRQQVPPAGK